MLIWLTLICAALAGLFFYFLEPAATLEGIPHWVIASAVAALPGLLYALLAPPAASGESRPARLALPIVMAAALGAGAYVLAQNRAGIDELARPPPSAGERASNPGGGSKSLLVRRNNDAKFIAKGDLNGSPAEFLIDTGAAIVLLRPSDAEKAGIDLASLDYSVPVETANGTAYAAPVRIRALGVGPIYVQDLEALVTRPGSLNENLLGISFLRRLRSYELSGDFLTLRE